MGTIRKPRHLYREEVELKPQKFYSWGVAVVIYKDSRVDMNILDEMYPGDWEDSYERIGDSLFCKITIHTDNGPRSFMDVGTESNMEAQKGEASSAFKRASTKAGIGRGLYTTPRLTISANKLGCKEDEESVKEAFRKAKVVVSDIQFEDDRAGEFVSYIQLVSAATGDILLEWSSDREALAADSEELQTLRLLMSKANMDEEQILKIYKVSSLKSIAEAPRIYKNCVERLEKRAAKLEEQRAEKLKAAEEAPEAPEEPAIEPDIEDDPLNASLADISPEAEPEEEPAPAKEEEKKSDATLNVKEDSPANLLSFNGVLVNELPEKVIKELSRKNSKLRAYCDSDSLNAIDHRAEFLKRQKTKK